MRVAMSLKERAITVKSLTCLLQAVVGNRTTIELRNETHVTGLIQHVDGYMNAEIVDAVLTTPSGAKYHFSNFFVQGRQIRFVQIPEHLDIVKAIENQIRQIRKPQNYQERAKPERLIRNTEKIRGDLYTSDTSTTIARQ